MAADGEKRRKRSSQAEADAVSGAVELVDRLPPQNLDAERAVLASLLLDPRMCDEVVLLVKPEDFYLEAHQKLFAHMLALHESGQTIDATLLVDRLKKAGDYEAVGGAAYLAKIMEAVAVPAHATYYARIVRDKSTLRQLIHATARIMRDAYEEVEEPERLLSRAEEQVFAIRDRRSNDQIFPIHDVLVEAFQQIDRRLTEGTPGGLATGFRDLDDLTGGLHESELIILAARPSMGKTALATNIAEYVTLELNVPCLFVSLEMARRELAQRMLCSLGKIDGKKFRSGFISSAEREKLVRASNQLAQAPLFIDDTPSRTVSEIAACARRLKRKCGLGLVVIDYLQLIEPDNPQDPRQEQVARITRRLKAMARELQTPVLCLAQLNRQVEQGREGHRPRLSHLRESGAIEQDADVVMFVHREEYYCHSREEAEQKGVAGIAEIIVAKQRNGPTGEVKLAWLQKYTRFENLRAHYEEFDAPVDQEEDESPF
ncbi:MAG: replicative DNA helicase [Thermoguttaceae bacterium]|nr:replicative DNA helicase [Thermoguttaceae bacterium]MDW8079384.1 replicative DNA helicase [Thermoguttaceae bacterium]